MLLKKSAANERIARNIDAPMFRQRLGLEEERLTILKRSEGPRRRWDLNSISGII